MSVSILLNILLLLTFLLPIYYLLLTTPIKPLLNLQNTLLRKSLIPKHPPKVQGKIKPGFEEVRNTFQSLFNEGYETGAQLAVYYKGELVVDLYSGYAKLNNREYEKGRHYEPMTMSETLLLPFTDPRVYVKKKVEEWKNAGKWVKSFIIPPEREPTCDIVNGVCSASPTFSNLTYIKWLFGDTSSSSKDYGENLKKGYLPLTGESLIPLFSCSKVAESAVIAELAGKGEFW
ncbi:hypothetical protein TL16_g09474 [Triparma laevis f. inornata]|uniref:Beta-lactamase-related domain-containing protein n=1 Tax=Triparma laevis f. inornata TaxID=1714386 RepID=A0A9W7ELL2_9STRA|nr:hypothetical protein TL16_g09474 [Triparma laevis f. inornata]